MTDIPTATHGVSPYLICAGAAEAIEFYKRAFGAKDIIRLAGPGGKLMHAALQISGSTVFLKDGFLEHRMVAPTMLAGSPVTIHLMVPDVDAVVACAWDAGAVVTKPPADQLWGDRCGSIRDPFGHSWSIATHLRDMTPDEIQVAMANATPSA